METSNRNNAPEGLQASEQTPPAAKIVLGKIASPFGVRGWTKVTSYTEPFDGLLDYKTWQVNQNGRRTQLTVQNGKPHGKFIVVKFDGIEDRDEVARLTNATIEISREELPEVQDGSYYWADLLGLAVATTDGVELGRVENIMETGANDVLVVKGDRERLIPWIMDDVIVKADLSEGLLTVDWDPDF